MNRCNDAMRSVRDPVRPGELLVVADVLAHLRVPVVDAAQRLAVAPLLEVRDRAAVRDRAGLEVVHVHRARLRAARSRR
jgi:hypothetical protein